MTITKMQGGMGLFVKDLALSRDGAIQGHGAHVI